MTLVTLGTIEQALAYSSILSFLAIGISLLYKTTKVPNFAHASFATAGAYSVYSISTILGLNPYIALIVAFSSVVLMAVLLFIVLEPLRRRKASTQMLMIATLAYDILMYGVLNVFADTIQALFKIPSRTVTLMRFDFTIAGLRGVLVVSLILLSLSAIILYLILNRTYIGICLRASMENQALAESIGINTRVTLLISWIIAGGLAGLGGGILTIWTQIDPSIGMLLIPSMFCASILGGLEEIYGAIIGGFLLGFVEIIGIEVLARSVGTWVTPYRPAIPLIILFTTLLLCPKGLVGPLREAIRKSWRRG
ncbi:branched-chain amino acid ABC transporter permease [Candidatus Korarchaeum cryptofilum]|uniref:Branched-chain amino acid ABC transporter permease n=1 Tax=Candidatus Korarchaeum cryptofilum TaxID=498846 RepID=A0A3R9QXK1_9CREN|nr:branched-chain amino acid ABC transporter permease [Candidatus Korarchaeum cryptofilum]RSN67230.1 branched-chain amino acid ABC transporter permease [Candidatus Korarchaeum cryptofilum]TDA42298.1 MAG: branched-chain amino acid ABC transporter permease [Candidatus Korarchaeota archaeon]